MKKLLILFVITVCICGNAVSDGPFTVTVDTAMDAFYIRSFTNDYSTKKPFVAGSPYTYQGEGDITGFQSSVFDDGLNGRVNFSYSGKKLGGLMEMRVNTDSGVLDNWYWEGWLRLGERVKVLAGNQGQRGQVGYFQNFDDFLPTKIDYFGVLYPAYQWTPRFNLENNFDTIESFPWGIPMNEMTKGFAVFTSTDTNDLFTTAGSSNRLPLNILFDVNFAPVTISASLGGLFSSVSRPFKLPWIVGQKGRANDYDDIYDPVLKNAANFGFRIEGAKIADTVNLAAVYKYADTLLYKPTAENEYNVVGEKTGNHAFGLYVNVTPFTGLGISAGYSGLLQTWKNSKDSDVDPFEIGVVDAELHYLSRYKDVAFPFYNGIDLRFSYTGIEKLSVTLNNNVSFGAVKGSDTTGNKNYTNTWVYIGELNGSASTVPGIKDRSESYLGLYNALGIKYAITDDLLADFQIANQHGIFTLNWEKEPVKSVTNYLGLYTGVNFTVIESEKICASIRGGVAIKLSSYSYQNAVTAETHKAGIFDFGIPLGIKVEF